MLDPGIRLLGEYLGFGTKVRRIGHLSHGKIEDDRQSDEERDHSASKPKEDRGDYDKAVQKEVA